MTIKTTLKCNWIRNTIFILFQPLFPPLGIFPTIIHETAHWFSALFIGVPISDIKVGWFSLGPGVAIHPTTPEKLLPFFFYSGGITSAIAVLFLYAFYWARLYYHNYSITFWIMSVIVLLSAVFQIYLGVLEGIYHQNYSNYLSIYSIQLFIGILIAIFLHFLIFTIIRKYNKRSKMS